MNNASISSTESCKHTTLSDINKMDLSDTSITWLLFSAISGKHTLFKVLYVILYSHTNNGLLYFFIDKQIIQNMRKSTAEKLFPHFESKVLISEASEL